MKSFLATMFAILAAALVIYLVYAFGSDIKQTDKAFKNLTKQNQQSDAYLNAVNSIYSPTPIPRKRP